MEEKIIGCSKHLFMRERKQYEWKARCFWSHGRLTFLHPIQTPINVDSLTLPFLLVPVAVSMDEEMVEQERAASSDHRSSGEGGKEKEGEEGKDKDVNIDLVEFNTFGPDMYTTSATSAGSKMCWICYSRPSQYSKALAKYYSNTLFMFKAPVDLLKG